MVALKRTHYDMNTNTTTKITKGIDQCSEQSINEETKYLCKAIVLHSSYHTRADTGHYISCIFNDNTKVWYVYNDAMVTPVEDDDFNMDYLPYASYYLYVKYTRTRPLTPTLTMTT